MKWKRRDSRSGKRSNHSGAAVGLSLKNGTVVGGAASCGKTTDHRKIIGQITVKGG